MTNQPEPTYTGLCPLEFTADTIALLLNDRKIVFSKFSRMDAKVYADEKRLVLEYDYEDIRVEMKETHAQV
jgi:hypothetical protein